MIESFACQDTMAIFNGESPRRFPPELIRPSFRKLAALEAADDLSDLAVPPANRLERLKGDFMGCWSLRINRQYRLVFRWDGGKANDVRIVDYH